MQFLKSKECVLNYNLLMILVTFLSFLYSARFTNTAIGNSSQYIAALFVTVWFQLFSLRWLQKTNRFLQLHGASLRSRPGGVVVAVLNIARTQIPCRFTSTESALATPETKHSMIRMTVGSLSCDDRRYAVLLWWTVWFYKQLCNCWNSKCSSDSLEHWLLQARGR
jgi:hypothetical protein